MNRVLLTGRLTRDPELRTTAGGKAVAQFSVASHEFVVGQGEAASSTTSSRGTASRRPAAATSARASRSPSRAASRPASWDDDKGERHWKTEIVASSVEMLSGRRKKDYAAETAAQALEAQAVAAGIAPDAGEPVADDAGFSVDPGGDDDDEEEDELLEEAVAAA